MKFCQECGAKLVSPAGAACPSCGMANPAGAKFCNGCGAKLEAPAPSACPKCGAALVSGTKFCNECGAPLNGAPAAAEQTEVVPAPAAEPPKLGELVILDPTSELVIESVALKGSHEDHAGKEGVTQFYFNEWLKVCPKSMFNPEERQAYAYVDVHKDVPTTGRDGRAWNADLTYCGYTKRFGLGDGMDFNISADNWLDGIYDIVFILDDKVVALVAIELIYK
jgi:hypothetical protein